MNDSIGELKRTPLTDVHKSLGAKMVSFAGFWMPVSYGSIIEEHNAVREKVGIFDVSHMGEISITGPDVKEFVNGIITNNCAKIGPGGVQYTVMCREDGTVVDDLLVAVMGEDKILIVVNAVNTEKDFQHIQSLQTSDIRVEDVSEHYALFAVQGPLSREVLKSCPFFAPVKDDLENVPYYRYFYFSHEKADIMVSRTGYTGELGFEIFTPPSIAPLVWGSIIEAGKPFGITPVGLAARDTLRFEAAYCLYGQEIDDFTTPLEAGLGWVVKLAKKNFVGRSALLKEKQAGSRKTLIGLELAGRAIARQGFPVMMEDKIVGKVTSGNFSPTLKKSLCMAFVDTAEMNNSQHQHLTASQTAIGAKEVSPPSNGRERQFTVEVRGKRVEAYRIPLPFYKSRVK